jgi:hypothetical protein
MQQNQITRHPQSTNLYWDSQALELDNRMQSKGVTDVHIIVVMRFRECATFGKKIMDLTDIQICKKECAGNRNS